MNTDSKKAGARRSSELINQQRIKAASYPGEEHYRRYFEVGLIGMAITSPTQKFLEVNDEMCRILGYDRHELLQLTWTEITHPADLSADITQFNQVMAGQIDGYSLDKRFIRKDGESVYAIISVKCQRRADGTVDYFVGLLQDITQRKQAEEKLRYQANLLANVSEAVIGTDMDFQIKSWNKAAEAIYGWTADEVIGKMMDEAIPTEYQGFQLEQILKRFLEAGQWRGEVIQQVKDGSKRHILSSVTLLRNKSGDPYGAVAVNRDITDRKRDEEQLRLQSAALKYAANAIVITDIRGTIQWVNPAFTQLTGYSLAEAAGKNPRDLVKSSKQDPFLYREMWNTILAGHAWQGELTNQRKDGSLYIVEQTITPLLSDSGEITHFIAIQQDITTRKQLEEEHEKLTTQFYQAQKMESIGRLAGGIAHDFNNLLVPIISNAELNMMDLPPDSQHYSRLKRIIEAGQRAASLTRQILTFSRQQEMEKKTLDLNQVISEFEPMLQRLIGEDIFLQTRLTGVLPFLEADKAQLEQVLLNLVINARDTMPDGGKLIIETDQVILDDAYTARHSGAQPGPYVLMAVSDTGQGMDAATQERIFEPFFTTKAPGSGSGLGLATVFGIVKQHGGNIWVYSEPGQGTTFKIYLPLAEALFSTAGPEAPAIEPVGGTETVLLVEDEASVRRLVAEILEEYGYRVLAAAEPEAALALAATHEDGMHLLLTDVIMPKMNGRKLYEQLVSIRPELKVLYMSGYTDNIINQHDILSEGSAFLQKPFTIEDLLHKVRAILG